MEQFLGSRMIKKYWLKENDIKGIGKVYKHNLKVLKIDTTFKKNLN